MILPTSNCFNKVAILVKHLNVVVAFNSHQDVVFRINKEMKGKLDMLVAHNSNMIALIIKDLQPIAFALTYYNISIRQKTNAHRIVYLAIFFSL